MTTKSYLYYPATYHNDGISNPIYMPAVDVLPYVKGDLAVILENENGNNEQGLYVFDGKIWRFSMPTEAVSEAWINGDQIDIYLNVPTRVVLPSNTVVYKNGQLLPEDIITNDFNSIYVVRTPKVSGGGGADPVLRDDLSKPTGSALVGYKTGTVEDALDAINTELDSVGSLSQAVSDAQQAATAAATSETNAAQSAIDAEDAAARAEEAARQASAGQLNSDWLQTDINAPDYIKNKPTQVSQFGNDAGFVDTAGARNAISVSGSLTYNSTTGVISYSAPLLAAVATSGNYTDLIGRPSLSTVATTGNYSDLIGAPAVPTLISQLTNDSGFINTQGARTAISVSGSLTYNSTTGVISYSAPLLASVATSGSYADLTNKPALAAVATSGAYVDLTGKPSIPTTVSQLTNDVGFVTADDVRNSISATGSLSYNPITGVISYTAPVLAAVATSGSYTDLTNKPAIPTALSQLDNDKGFIDQTAARTAISVTGSLTYNSTTGVISYTAPVLAAVATTGNYSDLTGKPALAAVATSGSYSDLANKPIIPTAVSQLTNDSSFITAADVRPLISVSGSLSYDVATGVISYNAPLLAAVATSGSYTDLTNKPSIPSAVSQLTNDTGFITASAVRPLISASGSISYDPVTGVISYTAPILAAVATSGNYGDLTNKPAIATATSQLTNDVGFVDAAGARSAISVSGSLLYDTATGVISYNAPLLATVATSGSYTDLINKPVIPTSTSQLTNDSSFVDAAGARGAISVSGSLSYNSTTGVISYTAPVLAAVATSGSYTDLTDKPSIPTATSQLTNDAGFVTSTGSVASAGKLTTPVTINGVSFDGSTSISFSTNQVSEGTNLYYTDARVRAAVLTGFNASNNTSIVATDNVVTAFSKTQSQLNTKIGTNIKDAANGYCSLGANLEINFRNQAGTFYCYLINNSTASRTYTYPDRNITIAGTDELTGKADLTGANFTGQVNGKSFRENTVDLGAVSGTVNIDFAAAGEYSMTLSSAGVTFNFTNTPTVQGAVQVVLLRLTNAGLGIITWPAGTLNTSSLGTLTSSGVDEIGIKWDSVLMKPMLFLIGKDVAK